MKRVEVNENNLAFLRKELTDEMIIKLRELGKLPYVQIIEDNIKSIGLAEKSGFVKHSRIVWFGIDREEKEQGVQ
jgi:hypothetical protein